MTASPTFRPSSSEPLAIQGASIDDNAAAAVRDGAAALHRRGTGRWRGLFAIPTTLLVVPYLFALLGKRNDGKEAHGVFAEVPE